MRTTPASWARSNRLSVRRWRESARLCGGTPERAQMNGLSASRLLDEHAIDLKHPRHVGHGLGERRNLAAVAVDCIFAGIVGGESQADILTESVHQKLKVQRAGVDVLLRIVEVRDAESIRGCGHELHQAHR